MAGSVRVVVAEDETLLREGLLLVLRGAGMEVVAVVGDAPALLAAVDEHRPDVVITDIRMPPGLADDGLQAALELRRRHPGLPVVVLSQFVQRRYALELLSVDPSGVGYLLKQRISNIERFCADVLRVQEGGTVLDPEVVQLMVSKAQRTSTAIEQLTKRQREVLAVLAEGRSNAAIAIRLTISEKAVVQHVSHIYDQLVLPVSEDDHRRVLAVLAYLAQ